MTTSFQRSFTGWHRIFLNMALLALSLTALPALAESAMAGHWVGLFELPQRAVFVTVSLAEKDQQMSGTLNMPSDERNGLALTEVKSDKNNVRFQLAGPDGTLQFDGALKGGTLAGTVSANGKSGTFTFQRTLAAAPERDKRYMGAYRFADKRIVVLSQFADFPQLYYTDLQSGRYGGIFASSDTEFFAGAGSMNPTVRELTLRFENDAKGNPLRMIWQPAGQAAQTAQRMTFRTEDVTYKNGGVTLSGTLVLPATKGPHPAVVLTQMSSPAPREAYGLQAYYFAANGIAALMYDKRGVGKSSGDWQKATMSDLADDAVAGIALLSQRSDIAAAKIGTWGHSQGGWLAPLAAVRSNDKVAFVIAQSASAVSPAEQEIFRIENSMKADGFSVNDIRDAVAYQRRLMHWVVSGGEGRAELLAAARAGDNTRWGERVELVPDTMRAKPREETTAFYRYDPLPDLAKLKAPIVYILGDQDNFVPVKKSAPLFEQTLTAAGHNDFEVWMLPNAAHGLWETSGESASAFINARYWARDHYPRMTQWLVRRGFASIEK